MAKKLAVANGQYQNAQGGTKTKWVNVGVILQKDGKEFMLIDPTINFAGFMREQGKDMVMVGIFEDNNQGQQQNNQQGGNQGYQQQQNNQPNQGGYSQPQQNQGYGQPQAQNPNQGHNAPQQQQTSVPEIDISEDSIPF